jgi:uncharacterized membrane protein
VNRLLFLGRALYALALIGLGALCFLGKDFIIGRPPPWPPSFTAAPVLGYVTGAMIVLSSLAIFLRRSGYAAGLVNAALIFFLSVARHLPHFMDDWLNSYKSMALAGGSLIIAASFSDRGSKGFLVLGKVGLSAFFIACGYAHFKFHDFVRDFVPAYIPFHSFFATFTGLCLIAGGVGIWIPAVKKWAALLSGIMVAAWFVLLHIPRFLTDPKNVSDQMGLAESLAIAGIFFVLTVALSSNRESRN